LKWGRYPLLPRCRATLAPPVEYPFTSTVQVDGTVPPEENGWIAVNVNQGVPQSLILPEGVSSSQAATYIVRPPIQRNKRKFTIIAPTWTFKRTIKISCTFTSVTQVIPADGTELVCYGISGDLKFEATFKVAIVGGVVVFDYPLPDTFTGLFYFSTNFVQTSITLTNSVTVDIRRYFAVGIYAELTFFN
jgi:hypothetical protein